MIVNLLHSLKNYMKRTSLAAMGQPSWNPDSCLATKSWASGLPLFIPYVATLPTNKSTRQNTHGDIYSSHKYHDLYTLDKRRTWPAATNAIGAGGSVAVVRPRL